MPTNQTTKKPIQLSIEFLKTQPKIVTFKDDFYQFNGKYYEELSHKAIMTAIQKFFSDQKMLTFWTSGKGEEMVKAIKYNSRVDEVQFDDYDNLINLNNGILNLDTKELAPHDDTYLFSQAIDVDYDPKQTHSPTFMQFLGGIFNNYSKDSKGFEADREVMDNIYRVGGYLIYPQNKMERLFMFLGSGENGKSMLIDVLSAFFDDKFISSLSLRTLSNETSFAREQLITSRINIAGEEKGSSKNNKINGEQIKRISSGQDIYIDRKNQKSLNFRSKTKIVVDSNGIPYFDDNTHGMMRRLCIFKFKNKFVSQEDYENTKNPHLTKIFPGKNRDKLLESILKEKSAILNMFLRGLDELREMNWKLPDTLNQVEMMEEYKETSDTLGTWLKNNYEINDKDEDSFVVEDDAMAYPTAHDIYQQFEDFYRDIHPTRAMGYSKNGIGRKIRELFRIDSEVRYDRSSGRVVKETYYKLNKIKIEDEDEN